jgi:hypothetical protein
VGIVHDLPGMDYPPFPVHPPQEKKLHDVLLIAGKPVHIFLDLGKGAGIAGVVELFGEFDGMEGMEVETLLVETRCGLKAEMLRERPPLMARDEGPFRVVEPETEFFLEEPIEREAHPLE